MAPGALGGRPRNAWNPSRQRKPVRLYMLTLLTKEEIQKVLESRDFNPSSSDIQKKLRGLFPSDYAKDHRKYRPSSDGNIKLRLDHLRQCKRGRISKERRLRSRFTSRIESSWGSHPNSINSHECVTNAFRNYTVLSMLLPSGLANSEPVLSSLLMLDGSSLSRSSNSHRSHLSRSADEISGIPSLNFISTADSASPNSDAQLQRSAKTASNIHGLGRRLADKYSDTYLKHIHSIMRYTTSNSWRSSVASFSSRASSLFSKFSAHKQSDENEVDNSDTEKAKSITPDQLQEMNASKPLSSIPFPYTETGHWYNKTSAMSHEDELSPKELEIWHELFDVEKLKPVLRPQYLEIAPVRRKCCSSSPISTCKICGFGRAHRAAIEDKAFGGVFNNSGIGRLDFYVNTPLHCAAAAAREYDFWKIRQMTLKGAHVTQCNTFGETFLHILCRYGPRTQKDTDCFLTILRGLSPSFPFSKRDYHGSTILHVLFQNSDCHYYTSSFLYEIFGIMNPNLSAKDNAGFLVRTYVENCTAKRGILFDSYCSSADVQPSRSWLTKIFLKPSLALRADLFEDWLLIATSPRSIDVIDEVGDTSLIMLLKCWNQDSLEDEYLSQAVLRMIQSGAIIHMRDRNGNTALAIASRRGFRLAVKVLLENGAIVHSRTYRGVGILQQVEQALAIAKDAGNSNLWSRIWSCQIALVNAGAVRYPTDEDEWRLPLDG